MTIARSALGALQIALVVGVALTGAGLITQKSSSGLALQVLASVATITLVACLMFLGPALVMGLLGSSTRELSERIVAGGPARGRAVGWLLVLGVLGAVGYFASRYTWARSFDLQHEVAIALALPVVLALTWSAHRLATWLSARVPRLHTDVWLTLALSLLVYLVLVTIPHVRGALITPLALVAFVLAGALGAARLSPFGKRRWAQAATALLSIASGCLFGMGSVANAVRNPFGAVALGVLRVLADRDADGFSAWFDGGDCDDADPSIHPLALEVVGNGVDDNCRAGDLALPVALPVATPTSQGARPDVVLISIDTLRADMLTLEQMPHVWRYAQAGRRYRNAYAAAPFTDLSLRSVFTGWPASDYDALGVLSGMDRTLADLMQEAGWQTYALVSVPDLGELVPLGFQFINSLPSVNHQTLSGVSAPSVTKLALQLLEQPAQGPRLLWAHYFEPHHHYVPHKGFERFGDSAKGRYRQEVAFVDEQLAPLLSWLSRPQVAARTVVVLFADHGEYLGEGGRQGHELTHFAPVVRVPLVLTGPGILQGTVDTPVSLLDVFPTVIEQAGIAGVAARFGTSLLLAPPGRVMFSEARNPSMTADASVAVRRDGKLLYCLELMNHCEICDEEQDPECRRPIVDQQEVRADALYRDLGVLLDTYRNDVRHRERKASFVARWSPAP